MCKDNQIVSSDCISAYPAPYEEINLRTIQIWLKDLNI